MGTGRTIVLSLGGSIIIPKLIDVKYLRKLRAVLLNFTRRGYRFIIVAGGGDICRHYQKSSQLISKVNTKDLDWIGIAATKLNAELVRSVFGSHAYHEVIKDPTKKIKTNKRIIVGAGWKPGSSSDKDAVLLAKTFGSKTVINLSNIKYVFTSDPKKDKSARPIKKMSWDELLDLTGRKWKPGAHVPFDPEASKLAKRYLLDVIMCLGTNLKNLQLIINQKPFKGTHIS